MAIHTLVFKPELVLRSLPIFTRNNLSPVAWFAFQEPTEKELDLRERDLFSGEKRNGMGRSVSDLMTLFSRFSGHSSLGSHLSSQKTICIAQFIYIQNSILNARTLSLCSSQATGNFDLLYVLYIFRNQYNTLIPNQTKKCLKHFPIRPKEYVKNR